MAAKNIDARIKERELIIRLKNQNKTCKEISELLGISKSKVSYWVKRYKDTKSLDDLPRKGRPKKLDDKDVEKVKKEILKIVNKSGTITTKEILKIIKKKTKKEYSIRHIQRMLHTFGLVPTTHKKINYSKYRLMFEKLYLMPKHKKETRIWVLKRKKKSRQKKKIFSFGLIKSK